MQHTQPPIVRRNLLRSGLRLAMVTSIGSLALSACSESSAKACSAIKPGPWIAVGDSLTNGFGGGGRGYAEHLGAMTGRRVQAFGLNGERTDGLLSRLPHLLRDQNPSLVILTIGGNDLLRRFDRRATRYNLERIIEQINSSGATSLIFAMPDIGSAGLRDDSLYDGLKGTMVIPDVFRQVLRTPSLRADAIHPNAEGYRRMAAAVRDRLTGCGVSFGDGAR